MENVVYMGSKNQYGYTKRQLMIDYKNKTFQVGQFKISVEKVTDKAIDRKIQELIKLGFKEIIEEFEELKKNITGYGLETLLIIEENNMEREFLADIRNMDLKQDDMFNYLTFDRDRILSRLGLYSDELC